MYVSKYKLHNNPKGQVHITDNGILWVPTFRRVREQIYYAMVSDKLQSIWTKHHTAKKQWKIQQDKGLRIKLACMHKLHNSPEGQIQSGIMWVRHFVEQESRYITYTRPIVDRVA